MWDDNIKWIKLSVFPRYWEDCSFNGIEDESIDFPGRSGEEWKILIDASTGKIENWPYGNIGKVHFKVCDAGYYYLLDNDMNVLYTREDNYVPSGLCHGPDSEGWGDYIIFSININGYIEKYNEKLEKDDWLLMGIIQ